MRQGPESKLSRREREMMDVIYARGQATAAEVREQMTSPPSYSAVRATLRILEEKGMLTHAQQGASYVYAPTVPRTEASRSAVRRVLDTFFGGSPAQAVAALLDVSDTRLPARDRKRLLEMIEKAEREGR